MRAMIARFLHVGYLYALMLNWYVIQEKFPGVFLADGKIATRNFVRGQKVYGEKLIAEGNTEYRMWDPYRSKLGGALVKGLKEMPINDGGRVLYLGAASGTTASHISDIVGAKGVVYAVEFAPRSMRDLIQLCEKRGNLLPILADARKPDDYAQSVGAVDVIYEDVAQPDQAAILKRNAEKFLKKGGWAMFAIKAPSIDVVKEPRKVFESELAQLTGIFEIVQTIDLHPFDEDHLFALLRKR